MPALICSLLVFIDCTDDTNVQSSLKPYIIGPNVSLSTFWSENFAHMLTLFNDSLALSFPPTIIDLEVVPAPVHIV